MWRNREALVSHLGTKTEMMHLEDLSGLANADDTFCLSFVSQGAGRLGPGEAILLPIPLLSAEFATCIAAAMTGKAPTIIPSPLFSRSPPPAAPSPSASTTKTVFCHRETAAVSQCQSIGFHSTL